MINGQVMTGKLTLGALAELETGLNGEGLFELIGRFEAGRFTGGDVLAVLVAGLRGGGWQGRMPDLLTADFAGGLAGAARMAALLLVRAFQGAN